MRKLFTIMAATALVLVGGIVSDASANSVTFVATSPTTVAVGGSVTFNVVMQIDPNVSGAVFQVDASPEIGITSAQNNMAGTNGFTSNFELRDGAFNIWPGSSCVGGADRTCTSAAPGAPSAGNAGGLSGATFNSGTYTIGSYTVRANAIGNGSVSIRIRQGFEWLDGQYNNLPDPTSNTLNINVIPEPATAGLIGLGLVGLVLAGRRNRA
jgi:hypothetical protein